MTRAQFLNDLYRRLGSLSREQAEKHLTYYAEMLADRMEEGMSEAEAVASMEDLDTIVQRILQDEGARPPRYPDLPEAEPRQQDQGRKNGSGRDWRKIAGIALWTAAIAVAVSVLWSRFFHGSSDRSEQTNVIADIPGIPDIPMAVEEADSGLYIGLDGIRGENFSIGPEGIYASGGGHEVYIGPEGIRVDGQDTFTDWNWFDEASREDYGYPGEAYTLPAEGIRKIDVVWAAGLVDIQPTEDGAVWFKENSTEELTDRLRMTYELKGETLTIRCWEEKRLNTDVQKHLTLLVPSSLLEELEVETTSACVWIAGLQTDSLEIGSASGDVELANITARSLDVDTSSGDTYFTSVSVEELSVCTASGCVNGNVAAEEVKVDTASGDVFLYTEGGKKFHMDSAGGDLYLYSVGGSATEISLDTTSGDAMLQLPGDMGFSLDFETVSGELDSGGFSLTRQGGKYRSGSGGCEIDVNTVSGDLILMVQ